GTQGKGGPTTLRISVLSTGMPLGLNPAKASEPIAMNFQAQLSAGLTELDSETNVVPHVARSWEVLEGGRRYLFHLRDDVRWTDGQPVTAEDFEWAWKWSLAPETHAFMAQLLDPIAGARSFRTGRNPDPQSVGVRSIDPRTLEVLLETPIAHFLYLTADQIAHPLPRHAMERHGEAWTSPEHFVSNGAFRVAKFGEGRVTLTRNPGYFAEFPGSLEEIEWFSELDLESGVTALAAGQLDILAAVQPTLVPTTFPSENMRSCPEFSTLALALRPTRPPLDNPQVRRALALALDQTEFADKFVGRGNPPATGGYIPRGMAGHSPNLSLPHDPDLARHLLAEAGYPEGRGFPSLLMSHWEGWWADSAAWIAAEWRRHLGIEITHHALPVKMDSMACEPLEAGVVMRGWLADYPDPFNFLRQSNLIFGLVAAGWRDADYEAMVERAAQTTDRPRRMAMYRQADRWLVAEQALVIPLQYGISGSDLVMPWVHGYKANAMRVARLKEVSIAPH
ncbi:MAG: peptide ABC transporter substrate-binding protein, partial [Pseudomonadota bacterium]